MKEWRVAVLVSQDISYRSWQVNKEGRINLSIGLIDSGAKAEIRHVDPCMALLLALGIWFDSKSILINEIFDPEGTASRTMTVNVSKNDIDRMVSISRSFQWHNEHMKVSSKVDPVPAYPSRKSIQDGCTLAKTPTSLPIKRSHMPSSTQQRLITTKLEDELMSGRDEGAACTTVTNESDDMFAIDCMESPDLQTPCDTTVA